MDFAWSDFLPLIGCFCFCFLGWLVLASGTSTGMSEKLASKGSSSSSVMEKAVSKLVEGKAALECTSFRPLPWLVGGGRLTLPLRLTLATTGMAICKFGLRPLLLLLA